MGTARTRTEAITNLKVKNNERHTETVRTDIRYCASHRGVMQGVRAARLHGGPKHACALCGEVVCLKESVPTAHGDIGRNHGFWETLILTFRGGRNGKKV